VLNAQTGAIIRQIATSAGSVAAPSGLGRITAWVENGAINNTVLWVYGGDLLGNLWRFDINGDLGDGDVGGSGFDAQLLATLADDTGQAQPISAKPEIGDVYGNTVVFIGTGRFLGTSDLADLSQQSIYAIKDPLTVDTTPSTAIYDNPRSLGSGAFVEQTDSIGTCPSGTPAAICGAGQSVRISGYSPINFNANNGWYLDLAVAGERANTDPTLVFGTLVFTTNKPEVSECMAGGYSMLYFVDYRTGGAVSAGTHGVVAKLIGNSFATRPTVVQLPNLKLRALIRMSDGTTVVSDIPIGGGSAATRPVSWRELITE
jgi:type IV pilus assembly protein PilY1